MLPGDIERLVTPVKLQETVDHPQGLIARDLEAEIERAERSPFFRFLIQEGIYADYAQALGGVHDKVVEAALPELIGRELCSVTPVTKDPVRMPKAKKGKAWRTGEAETPITPETYEKEDITAYEIKSRAEWTETFLEDAEWNAEARLIKEAGRSVGELETEDVDAMLEAIAAANLAGGAEVTITDGAITWAQFINLINAVQKADFHPKVVGMPTAQYAGLLKLDQFIRAQYYAPERAIRTGVVETTLGVKVVHSTKLTSCTCIDTDHVVMTVRRELNTKPYEDPAKQKYGALANERIGMSVLRTTAVARGDH